MQTEPSLPRQHKYIFFALIPPLLLLAFWRAFGLGRFHDDWGFVHFARQAIENGRVPYLITHPIGQHWSPLWHSVEVLNYLLVGSLNDIFIRSFVALTQTLSLVALVLLCLHWRLRPLAILSSMLVLGLHHTSAGSLYSFDAYSQCAADCLGWWGALLLIKSRRADHPAIGFFPLILLVLGLLFKEQALATAAIYIWILIWTWLSKSMGTFSWKRAVSAIAPVLTIVVVFTALRRWSGVPLQFQGAFRLSPLDTPRNLGQMLTALLSPVRTLAWFDAFRATPRQWGVLVLLFGAAFLLATLLVWGLCRSTRSNQGIGQPVFFVLGAMFLSWFPTSLMAHIGELYVHTSLFWFAMLVGLAVEGWLRVFSKPWQAAALLVALSGYAFALAAGLRANLSEMRLNGERANSTIQKINKTVSTLPEGTVVQVCDASSQERRTDYGLYRNTIYGRLVGLRQLPEYVAIEQLTSHVHFVPDTCSGKSPLAARVNESGSNPCLLVIRDGSFSLQSCQGT